MMRPFAVILSGLLPTMLLAASQAWAQEGATPMPRPATQESQSPPSILPPPAPGIEPVALRPRTQAKPGQLAPEQRAALEQVNAYFNRIRVMSGSFTQVAQGSRSEGKFYVSKPGRLRFQYNPPSPLELISDGRTVAVRDRKLNTQDIYSLSQTPLQFLLDDRMDLMRDSKVVGVYADAENLSVTLEESAAIGGTARIDLVFSARTYELQQWTITDAQGYETTVRIYDIDTASRPSDKLFVINLQPILRQNDR